MKKIILIAASVLAMGATAQADQDTCHVLTAGEDQKLECVQEKLENKIRKLSKLLAKAESKLQAEIAEEMSEGDVEKAQLIEILKKAVQKIRSELLEAQEEVRKLVKKHHELDERTDRR